MTRLAFYFDSTRCVGCKTCVVACNKKNHLPLGVSYRRVRSYEVGEFPAATFYHWSGACNHCENPACVRACPTNAMYKSDDGTVQHDDDTCIGCGSCVIACPYDVLQIVADERIAKKCNACVDTREVDGAPTCVASCGATWLEDLEHSKRFLTGHVLKWIGMLVGSIEAEYGEGFYACACRLTELVAKRDLKTIEDLGVR